MILAVLCVCVCNGRYYMILVSKLLPWIISEWFCVCSCQWFGNLVTMQWWNDLWLNEGFAKFMEFVSVNITNPELQVVSFCKIGGPCCFSF